MMTLANTLFRRRQRGFTLLELMIAVVIVAIIVAVALPSYTEHLQKSRRAEGKAALLKAAQLLERDYTSNGRYANNLQVLFGAPSATVRSGEDPNTGYYALTIALGDVANGLAHSYVLTATPTGGFADPDCGPLTLSSTGARGFTTSNGRGTKDTCW